MLDRRTPGFSRRPPVAVVLAGAVTLALLATGTMEAAGRQTGARRPPKTPPPGPVTGFTATAGPRSVTLRWTNPVSSTFQLARILSRTDTWPVGPRDPAARVVYGGSGTTYIDSNLENLRRYYYKAYAYNYGSGPSAPASASAMPVDTSPPVITALTGDSAATVWSSKEVRAGVTDPGGVAAVVLYYRQDNARVFVTAAMSLQTGSLYRASIPSTSVEITPIQYYIQAWDFTGNTTANPRSAPTTTHTITPQAPPRGSINGYCRGCHGPGGSSGAQADFRAAAPGGGTVDRTACVTCHVLSHYGYGGVSTAYGKFRSAGSPFVDAKTAHIAHSVNRGDAMGCGFGCHNVAACIACHTTVSHGGHGALTQPYLRVGTAGDTGEALVTCANEACHRQLPDVLGEGWLYDGSTDQWSQTNDSGRPECLGCHTSALGHRSLHRAPTAGATACVGCHMIDLLGEHTDRRAIACSACHQSADAAVQAGISAGRTGAEVACFDCHGGGGSTSIHDFTVVASDGSGTANQDSCIGCHVLSHFGYGGVSTAYGRFLSADSPSLDPVRIHAAHSVNRGDSMGCGYGCHNVVDCRTCHDQVPHGNHSGRTEPYLRVNTAGETGTVLVPCANSACHGELYTLVGDGDLDPSTGLWDNGASEAGQPQCANCHPWTNASFGR